MGNWSDGPLLIGFITLCIIGRGPPCTHFFMNFMVSFTRRTTASVCLGKKVQGFPIVYVMSFFGCVVEMF